MRPRNARPAPGPGTPGRPRRAAAGPGRRRRPGRGRSGGASPRSAARSVLRRRDSGSTRARDTTTGRRSADLPHQLVDVLELPEDGPPRVPLPPVRVGREPHRERLGEVLVRMALRVPLLQVYDEAPAVRPRHVVVAVALRRLAEEPLAAAAQAEPVGVLDGVPRLVAQEPHAPLGRAALDLEHVGQLEPGQPGVGEVEGDGDPGHAVGAVPLVGEPEVRPEAEPEGLQLAVELVDPVRELALPDREPEVAEPDVQEPLVGPGGPLGLGWGGRRAALGAAHRACRRKGRRPSPGAVAAGGVAPAAGAAASSGETAEHGLGVADLELPGLLDVQRLHDPILDQHRVAL